MILHGYFRSSASYRVRIALSLKGLSAVQVTHHLRKGEQRSLNISRSAGAGALTDNGWRKHAHTIARDH
jgi:hypothetical protein